MSLSDAIQIASALWVKEAVGVPDLEFLTLDDWSSNEAKGARRLSLLRLQDFADGAHANSDVMAAVRLTRRQPALRAHSIPQFPPAGARDRGGSGAPMENSGPIGFESTPTEEAQPDFRRRMATGRSGRFLSPQATPQKHIHGVTFSDAKQRRRIFCRPRKRRGSKVASAALSHSSTNLASGKGKSGESLISNSNSLKRRGLGRLLSSVRRAKEAAAAGHAWQTKAVRRVP